MFRKVNLTSYMRKGLKYQNNRSYENGEGRQGKGENVLI